MTRSCARSLPFCTCPWDQSACLLFCRQDLSPGLQDGVRAGGREGQRWDAGRKPGWEVHLSCGNTDSLDAEWPVSTRTRRVSCTATVERAESARPQSTSANPGECGSIHCLGFGHHELPRWQCSLGDSCPPLRTSKAAHVWRGGFLKAMEDWQACGESWGQDWRGDPSPQRPLAFGALSLRHLAIPKLRRERGRPPSRAWCPWGWSADTGVEG